MDSFYAYDFSNPKIYYDPQKNYYGNITYNVPILYENPNPKPYQPKKRRFYGMAKYAAGSLTEDGLHYLLNSRKQPTFDINYGKDLAKGYLHGITINGILNLGSKVTTNLLCYSPIRF